MCPKLHLPATQGIQETSGYLAGPLYEGSRGKVAQWEEYKPGGKQPVGKQLFPGMSLRTELKNYTLTRVLKESLHTFKAGDLGIKSKKT